MSKSVLAVHSMVYSVRKHAFCVLIGGKDGFESMLDLRDCCSAVAVAKAQGVSCSKR